MLSSGKFRICCVVFLLLVIGPGIAAAQGRHPEDTRSGATEQFLIVSAAMPIPVSTHMIANTILLLGGNAELAGSEQTGEFKPELSAANNVITEKPQKTRQTPRQKPVPLAPRKTRPDRYRSPKINIRTLLGQAIDLSVFRSEMSFEEALNILQGSTNPPIPLMVLWREIQNNAYIDKTTSIGMDGRGKTTIARALQLLLLSMDEGGSKLQYVADGGVVTIATIEQNIAPTELRVYDVSELTMHRRWLANYNYNRNQYGNSNRNANRNSNRNGSNYSNSTRPTQGASSR